MDKKGFLLAEETLKIIIAVICISFLVYLLVSLYMSNKNKDLEFAKQSLGHLVKGLSLGNSYVEIYNPYGWGIVSFSSPNLLESQIPKTCIENRWKDCICICKESREELDFRDTLPTGESDIRLSRSRIWLDGCNNKNGAVCRENIFSVVGSEGNYVEITNPPVVLEIDYENKIIRRV